MLPIHANTYGLPSCSLKKYQTFGPPNKNYPSHYCPRHGAQYCKLPIAADSLRNFT
jgi:hypothetical protein